MSEKLLRKQDIAAILDTTPNVAAAVLIHDKNNCDLARSCYAYR